MKILIIGLGSIARKHISVIKEIDSDLKIYALRSNKNASKEEGIVNVFSYDEIIEKLDFCIISNPTSEHFDAINSALDLNIPLFIEKPSLLNLDNVEVLINKINKQKILTYVALNLRFHPVIKFLKTYLQDKRVIEASVYCGSFLPDWRPNIDYTKNYSAIAEMGGGVHLDLIHEIDYSIYLFGEPKETFSIRKKISDLEINSCDKADYNLLYDDKFVNISLNYYRKQAKRQIEIVTDNEIITADLINNTITDSNNDILFSKEINPLFTYKEQMVYFYNLIKGKQQDSFSSFNDSLETLKICLINNKYERL